MEIKGDFPIYLEGRAVGLAKLAPAGLYTEFDCRCEILPGPVCRLVLDCGDSLLPLGIPVPEAGELVLRRKLPTRRLPDTFPKALHLVPISSEVEGLHNNAPELHIPVEHPSIIPSISGHSVENITNPVPNLIPVEKNQANSVKIEVAVEDAAPDSSYIESEMEESGALPRLYSDSAPIPELSQWESLHALPSGDDLLLTTDP